MSDLGKKRGFWAGTEAQSIVNDKIIKQIYIKFKYESELKKNQQKLLEEYQNKSKLQNEEHKKQIEELKVFTEFFKYA
jgi:hypothetical protein